MTGRDGNRVWALPLERTLALLARHHRLAGRPSASSSGDA